MESEKHNSYNIEADTTASSRKADHIDLAFKSAVSAQDVDSRFNYEPMLSSHSKAKDDLALSFLGCNMKFPLWVSSMTGGTEKASIINKNLAKMCGQFGLGMGLGSCRQLLFDETRFSEFDVREFMPGQPLYANIGIAQVEKLLAENETQRLENLVSKLNADGLIIHINPLQEWMQPEGDRYHNSPISTIELLLKRVNFPIIVKEVGQGFGPESLKALLKLPLAAIDLAGLGGTNFSKLELLRSNEIRFDAFKDVFKLGHSCHEMVDILNALAIPNGDGMQCDQIIFSGGIKTFLDGYYFIKKSKFKSIYAQASAFLKYAMDYNALVEHVNYQLEGLKMANNLLTIKH